MNQQVLTPNNNAIALGTQEAQNAQALVAVESSRAVQEVQASLIIAKRFPRDEAAAQTRIINACQRPGLAEVATYQYSRGGTEIEGPSIRLAESIAQYWGNLDFGWREIERRAGESTVKAYCWDKETNTMREMTFNVKHVRDTKQGQKILKDERDIYENNANQASRRMRACILSIIPGDIVEEAVNECAKTLKAKVDITEERKKKLLETFASYGVNREMIQERIQRNLDAITPAQFLSLGKIANSLKDGMGTVADYFNTELADKKPEDKKADAPASNKKTLDDLKKKEAETTPADAKGV